MTCSNPVEARLIPKPESYAWSSHRFYLQQSEVPEWLRTEEVMGEFSSITQFHEFVLEGNDKALQRFYYGVEVEDLVKGKRGKDNEPRKVGMYLAKELCDLKLKGIVAQFGTGSYGTVGWACHGVASRTQTDAKFRKRISSIRRSCQQKI